MKKCKKCNIEKELTDFYKNLGMADGYLNQCIECVKARVNKHRNENIEKAREYDRKRAMLPHRVEARNKYIKTPSGKESKRKTLLKYKKKYPMAYAAHIMFGNAIRDKKINKENNCSICKSNLFVDAHHDDYTKPFDVRWLCRKCHTEWHKVNEPIYE
jgi:ribosomal protein S27AE